MNLLTTLILTILSLILTWGIIHSEVTEKMPLTAAKQREASAISGMIFGVMLFELALKFLEAWK